MITSSRCVPLFPSCSNRLLALSVPELIEIVFLVGWQVEPSHRAYKELGVRAVLTGRRRSQGAERAALPIVEIDSTGLVKINPLIEWGFKEVKAYIDEQYVSLARSFIIHGQRRPVTESMCDPLA